MDPDSDSPKEPFPDVAQELMKQLLAAHEKKKAYSRKYMQGRRSENKEAINEYKRQLYKKKKERDVVSNLLG